MIDENNIGKRNSGECNSASVRKAEYFDFNTLFRLALHKSSSKIQVA